MSEQGSKSKFQIFRAEDAPGLMESGHMKVEPYTDLQRQWVVKAKEAGLLEGDQLKVLLDIPGFNLTYAWLKKEYPLPLHSHDSDCLYYIIAGDVRIGTERLGAGDGFFVPAGVPYQYTPGEDGVEVLEFRTVSQFNMLNLSKGEGFWRKAVDSLNATQDDWAQAVPPSKKLTHLQK
ncbi:cupin domain-containing protein [Sphingobium tyrosinilyticum]|uniref:Cupin domain-containing protein n=1 Tax=Sphingobium tyrosinilyticum TaxID=2715436 RepID=A0ABV9F1C9_9SPHN